MATGKPAVLVSAAKLSLLAPPASRIQSDIKREWVQRYGVAAYHWAPDSQHLLFDANGQLWLHSLDTGTAVQLTSSADESSDPKFSPDGKRLSFVRKHDIWVRNIDSGEGQAITGAADENLFNGEVDWVYAEELGVRSNYFWSPDGRQIAFLQMNEKDVPAYPITDWTPVAATVTQEKYPKPGDPNPVVRLGVVASSGGRVKWMSLGPKDSTDFYIPRFGWVRDGLLWVEVLNREQTRLDLYFVDSSSGRSRIVFTEEEPDAWIQEDHYDPHFLKSGDRFLWLSWRDGHSHLYLYSFNPGDPLATEVRLERQLTQGDFEVSEINAVDRETGTVFVTANREDPRQTAIYSLPLNGGPMQLMTPQAGSHSASFSPDAKNFVDTFSNLTTPPRLSFCRVGAACASFWEAHSLVEYDLIVPERIQLKAADGATTLYGMLILPPSAKDGHGKFPLLMNPYGGPTGQSVRDVWGGAGYLFDNILAQHGIATLVVDNRGMGGRGKKFAVPLRHQLGKIELEDQLAALDQVLQRYPALDGGRLGWWGGSYGGYMTLYAMTHSNRIRAGVSISPVTNWRLYDSIYTERYMGSPKDNDKGYRDSSPVNAAADLKGSLLEVHGTSDDNVHLQNTIQMIRSLIQADKQFDLQLYPNRTHGITGVKDRAHLYHRVLDFFERQLSDLR